ncbi:tyrosine-type recombinase/integrase [Umezawaea beigongshangensis]|uniref:tyrosine-type recombinase/integrase n=1 Tax=Umezawaea beigongshangensis TaxID=2780383 RepID=UPI0018F1F2EF|nr:site-specific integrase [Umezawaea beigongshangensis]
MGHVQDRWFTSVPDPDQPSKRKRVPTARHGVGKRYKARITGPDGNEVSESFADGQYKAAKQWVADREVKLALGTYVDTKAGRVRLETFGTRWIADLDVDELSRENLERRFRRRIFPALGRMELGAVKPSTIRAWDAELRREGLSDRYRHTLFGNLSALFTAAVDDGLIVKNPLGGKSVKKPKPVKKKIVPWPEERVWAVQAALVERFRVLVDLGAGLGLRQGECFALAVDDVDFEKGTVRVCRQVKTVRSRPVFALPKYDKVREVPLSAPVTRALRVHMARFPPVKITLPWNVPSGTPTTAVLIVTSVRGLAIAANDFNRNYWKKALEAAGVPHDRYENGMHDLRHFFASLLLDQGESIKAVAEWLGHTDPSFTLSTYTHLMPSSDERTKSVIDGVYARRPGSGADGPATARDTSESE